MVAVVSVPANTGVIGDGTTDDTAAINAAITDGNRCLQGCVSSLQGNYRCWHV